eukprot:Pgem_evm1s4088
MLFSSSRVGVGVGSIKRFEKLVCDKYNHCNSIVTNSVRGSKTMRIIRKKRKQQLEPTKAKTRSSAMSRFKVTGT